ncbi:energy transducer TonB [Catenovulum maritimum]|uniref:Protein TonB n=1 Tax=Catenovulum maritimum TaxID=1513271 RepID=A0A0J8GTG7_9ALTE|nr:energy transducer TonB [Catenovulum maritimum]KMT64599.1 periplasmic protein TonB [Catenovulum maritimum]
MIRYLIAIGLAVSVTFLLFFGMQSLIASGEGALKEPAKGKVLDFVRVKKEQVVEKQREKPKKPPKPQEPPPPMDTPPMDTPDPAANAIVTNFAAEVKADVGLQGGLSLGSGDGDFVPITKVAPVYPRRAQQRGIEGYVIVEFTVTKLGKVKDPVVVKAEPENIFDKAAVAAAMKFKYKPRVVNGEPMEVAGVQNKISFEID